MLNSHPLFHKLNLLNKILILGKDSQIYQDKIYNLLKNNSQSKCFKYRNNYNKRIKIIY